MVSGLIVGSPIVAGLSHLLPAFTPIWDSVLFSFLNLMLVIGMTLFIAIYLDHRTVDTLGLLFDAAWWRDLGFGLALGALLMSLVFLIEWLLGWIAVTSLFYSGLPDYPWSVTILQPLTLFIVVGINEELLSRGYQLRNLAEGFAFPWHSAQRSRTVAIVLAWVFSSTLFGLLHIFNPNSTWISTIVLMLAGGCLGLGYILTGRLGMPIGLHITWNLFQGNVYGFPVSGNVLSPATVIQIQQRGPVLWTGGAFGPEAGILGIIAILLGALLTLWWVRWHYGEIQIQSAIANYTPNPFVPNSYLSGHQVSVISASKQNHLPK